ncbi:hypothetical protein D3C76_45330 [compost metagenome]
MSKTQMSLEDHPKQDLYEIRFKGQLDIRWADWFEGMSLSHASDGTTTLFGPVADQAALLGLLRKLRDLGLPLVSVNQVHANPSAASTIKAGGKEIPGKWLVFALLMLSVIPVAAGIFRLTELARNAEITPANARFFASPLPVVLHILSASIYAILGPFQFAPGFRRSRPGWHRMSGRLLVLCGLITGISGLWMTLFYPRPDDSGDLLYALRLLFGSGMVVSILIGFAMILRGDWIRHRAWMMRSYAIGLGAGTQVLTQTAGELIIGPPSELSKALLMGAGWVINLAVAEWVIRRRPASAHTLRTHREQDNVN